MVKKIHYIWLGGKKKSRAIQRCIKSWEKYMPDWEVIEWNETNLNIDINSYCRQAYNEKKYAFASDVLRFDILYREGGLYFDTDVKMLKSFEKLVNENEAFTGFEYEGKINPGLVLYSKNPGNDILKKALDLYDITSFFNIDGTYNLKVVGEYFMEILSKFGFLPTGKYQKLGGFTIFPATYFCPTDGIRSISNFTKDTYSVHLYAGTWVNKKKKASDFVRRIAYSVFKPKGVNFLKKIFKWRMK